eukprot:GHVR01092981.1.p1 GENE.GHVR01092981.1~~GHVR01092981.1.p1  ORF type:complete len:267 (+),score=74.60 GHVR01092981.1:69-869(+)
MNALATTRLTREYNNLQKSPTPQISVNHEDSLLICHFVFYDLPSDTPYAGGMYHGKLVLPKDYPHAPPSIYMITPSGRFETNTRLCLTISDFFPDKWNPAWGIRTVLIGLLSFMLDAHDYQHIGSINCSKQGIHRYALNSYAFNKKDQLFCSLFPEFTDDSKFDSRTGFVSKRVVETTSSTNDTHTHTTDNTHTHTEVSTHTNQKKNTNKNISPKVRVVERETHTHERAHTENQPLREETQTQQETHTQGANTGPLTWLCYGCVIT